MRSPRFIYTAVGIAALLLASCSSGGEDKPTPESAPSVQASDGADGQTKSSGKGKGSKKTDTVELAADPAPEFEVETFEGGTFAIREELGTPVVLNFWESW